VKRGKSAAHAARDDQRGARAAFAQAAQAAAHAPVHDTSRWESAEHDLIRNGVRYKLMAYKDEYEVARLSLDPRARAAVRGEFGPGAREYYLLHPPILRALGRKNKLRLGPWFRSAFVVLRALKSLRGTAFDPFGHTRARRTERELISEYRAVIENMLASLSQENYGRSVELAALPDMIRGYEEIKLASVEKYRARVRELTAGLALAGS